MRQEDSRRPVWEFADRVQITRSVLEAQWKALVVPPIAAGADFEPANPPKQLSKLIIDYRLS